MSGFYFTVKEEHETRYFVDADTEEEARQRFEDGDVESAQTSDVIPLELVKVEKAG